MEGRSNMSKKVVYNNKPDPITSIKEYKINEKGKRVLVPMTEEEEYRNAGITKEEINKDKKSAYDMTDKEVVKVVDPFLDVSDFNDDGSDIETLRDILEGNHDK